jgi:Fe-S cluster assembly iron-binding protein IscA
MLTVTENAASVIDNLIAARRMPTAAGVRITREDAGSSDGDPPRSTLHLRLVQAPRSGDYILSDARVFLEPDAAAVLDDKLLDAELAGAEVRFDLKQQS